MSGEPAWRIGFTGYELALAGLWTLDISGFQPPDHMGNGVRTYSPGDEIPLEHPVLVRIGSLDLVSGPISKRPRKLTQLNPGTALLPIPGRTPGSGVRLVAHAHSVVEVVSFAQLMECALASESAARLMMEQMSAALERQHWALRMSSATEPMERLARLLCRIVEDRGHLTDDGYVVTGAPEPREMAVLAGVSRESAKIDLEWLRYSGIIRIADGRLIVTDLEALKRYAGESE